MGHGELGAGDYADLARRVRVLEDKEALRGLLIRGWRALDLGDWDTWIGCWAEDAELDFGPWGVTRGRAAIREVVERAEAPFRRMQHHVLNAHFEVEGDGGAGAAGGGDRASGVGYMWFLAVTEEAGKAEDAEESGAPFAMGGPYEWEFRRGPDGGWLLVRLSVGVWWTDGGGAGTPEAFR
ncbi:nuclear transport factor 2 family protein [Streptomyces sp. NPDC047014]|uniref:nuclear transport factor 2 family protein n=1 Tax=Streptomyces sp. NPDC047014 TaxID=3155736 RepID=UPI0033D0E798